jgi:hypothetical protein
LRDKQLNAVIVVIQLLETDKRILCVSLGSGCDAGRIQMAGTCFLNERLEVGPNLFCGGFAVPIVVFMGIQAALQQQTYCLVEQLLGGVWIFTQDLYFLAILTVLEENFGGILRGINAPEKRIILQEYRWGGMTVCCHHLVKYFV